MFPSFKILDSRNMLTANSELFPDGSLGEPLIPGEPSYFIDLRLREFCVSIFLFLLRSFAPLSHFISFVLRGCAKPKMARAYAFRIITPMSNTKTFRNRTIVYHPGRAMSFLKSVLKAKILVSGFSAPRFEKPTLRHSWSVFRLGPVLVHFCPKFLSHFFHGVH